MSCTPAAANREYLLSLAGWMALYMSMIFLAEWNEDAQALPSWAVYAVALGCALPTGGVMVAVLRLMSRVDEFMRAVMVRRFVIATGVTLFLCGAWGFLETYAGFQHVELWTAFPIFWAAFGVVSAFVKSTK